MRSAAFDCVLTKTFAVGGVAFASCFRGTFGNRIGVRADETDPTAAFATGFAVPSDRFDFEPELETLRPRSREVVSFAIDLQSLAKTAARIKC